LKNRHFFNSPEQKSVNKTRNSDWIQKKLRIERFRKAIKENESVVVLGKNIMPTLFNQNNIFFCLNSSGAVRICKIGLEKVTVVALICKKRRIHPAKIIF